MFHQADLFEQPQREFRPPAYAFSDLVERISSVSKRPRYALLVLNLIARTAGSNGSLGPYVQGDHGAVPVRDWLCQALAPLAQRDCRRMAMIEAVRSEILSNDPPCPDAMEIDHHIEQAIQARILRSGRTNISRAVSDLVRAGLLRRHYQGYRVDHPNRGAQREAVYTILPEVRNLLARH